MNTKIDDVPLWAPFEDRRRVRDEKRYAVLRMAVKLFLEVGYHRATLTDVATRLNITKPALYNYFRSKEQILDECNRLGLAMLENSITVIETAGGSGLAKLRAMIRAYALVMTTDFGMCVVRLDDRELSREAQEQVRAEKRKYDAVFRSYVAQGISDGSIAKCDPKLTAFAIAGSLNWIGHWYQLGGKLPADDLADEFALRLTEGLVPSQDRLPAGKAEKRLQGRREGSGRKSARADGSRTTKRT